jgi:hypothetical protein
MSDKIATPSDINSTFCLNIFETNTYRPSDKIPTKSEITACSLLDINTETTQYADNQCVKLDDIYKKSIIIPVTITESVTGESKLDTVDIYLVDFQTNATLYKIGSWACGSVNGSKSANIVCNIPDNVLNSRHCCLAVYCGKTGATRRFVFTAHFPSFTISNSYTGIREKTWYGESGTTNNYKALLFNMPTWTLQLGVGPAASVIGGPGIEKLQKITIAITN